MSLSGTAGSLERVSETERVLLVGVLLSASLSGTNDSRKSQFQAAMDEAEGLVEAAGGMVVARFAGSRERSHAALFVGTGKADEIAVAVKETGANLVVFNHRLTPTQERNLERVLQCRVLDRVGLILAIFARRARSREGRLQVELAQLKHLSSRLVRGYGHLKSQRGGIGLKGPGETQLESDRRKIAQKIHALEKQLSTLKKQRATQSKLRRASSSKLFAFVGYTNSGKSTLFNRLTKSDVLAENLLFATLDTTTRRFYVGEGQSVILSDTVGFVRDLPHELVAAFSATLEETVEADVLLHVIDAGSPDVWRRVDDVNAVLERIGAHHVQQIFVYNKADTLSPSELEHVMSTQNNPRAVFVSATKGLGLDTLQHMIAQWALAPDLSQSLPA